MNLGHIDTIIAFAAVMAGVSLIVTALTQAVSALLNLRGLNLKWGLQELFRTLSPGLKEQAGLLAQTLTRHPLLTDSSFSWLTRRASWCRNATHIRQKELNLALQKLIDALAMPATTEAEKQARTQALDALGVPEDLRALGAAACAKLTQLKRELAEWFDTSMDRVSQRFASNMRLVTVMGSALVTGVFLFDSLEVWKRLSIDSDLRARIIAGSDALLQKADEMAVGSANPPAAAYLRAAEQLLALHTNELKQSAAPAGVSNLASGLNWLRPVLATNKVSDTNRYFEEYQALVPQAALRQAANNFNDLVEQQFAAGFFHTPYPESLGEWCEVACAHGWGLLVSVVLLSLGAPFWFNLLRTMSNLRPLLANKETLEQQRKGG